MVKDSEIDFLADEFFDLLDKNLPMQNAKAVNGDVTKVGNEWKGIRIIVEVSCQNRNATVKVKPTAGSQLVKAVGVSGQKKLIINYRRTTPETERRPS